MAESLTLDIYAQTLQTISCLHVMCIGTIDFCYFIPLSVALILALDWKVGRKQNLLDLMFDFQHSYQLIRMIFDLLSKLFKVDIVISL